MEEEVPSFHQVINELISSTYFIATLPFKWQAIRDKLEKLNWILKAAPYSGEFVKDSLLPKLLRDMSTALTEIRLLADHCGDGSYNGGKLLMKSDIDKASSRLDILIKHFTELYGSGIPMDSNAILVAKPASTGASRDDMKFYIEDLFLRLRIGDLEMKASALETINKILVDDEKYIMILVMDVDNGIQVLVSLLEFSDVSLQEEALAAILIIAGFNSYKGALITAGVVGPLVRILEAGSKLGKVRAGWTLKNLTENSDNVWSVSANGGVTALINLIGDVESCTELIYPSCEVLQNLCNVIEIKRFMVEEGVISVFLELLASKEEAIRIRAIEFLTAIASDDHGIKEEIVRGGATYKLLKFLNPSTSHSMKEREVSLRAMEQCCFSSTNSINVLIGSRLISWVMFFLNKGDISIQEVALQAMLSLCEASEEAKKAMGESGFMSVIVKLLDAKSSKACELAAELLVKLVSVQKNRKRFINEEQNVNRILELLNPGEDAKEAKKYLLPLLSSLTTSNSGRRKIAASGYAKNLERLAQIDVIDAKKIVKKITCNRFRSLLNGIWSF
ncbi:hypothetical protein IEQ34_018240 [Dendrobium chrysotoxum]|uniref:Uncharacterized protein n=1 Tax=Dendrobium chrysotoxum TaxID=161865 RepID=A0AAV7GBS1_DENCH|nr:hypothetical protein IEQ34_018240 [Dendrobium chrysotoxum]